MTKKQRTLQAQPLEIKIQMGLVNVGSSNLGSQISGV